MLNKLNLFFANRNKNITNGDMSIIILIAIDSIKIIVFLLYSIMKHIHFLILELDSFYIMI